MTDLSELKELARILGVDLSQDEAVMDAVMEENADYIGTGLNQVRHD